MAIRAGRKNRKMLIQKPSYAATLDQHGETPKDWEDVTTVWAEVKGLSGNESVTGGQSGGVISHAIRIDWRPDVTNQCQGIIGGRYFGFVAAIDPDERRRELLISAIELVPPERFDQIQYGARSDKSILYGPGATDYILYT